MPSDGKAYIGCNTCLWVAKHPNRNRHATPGSITEHLAICTKYQQERKKSVREQLMQQRNKTHTEAKMTSEKLCERLLRVAVAGNMSFRAATNPELIKLLSEGWPDTDMPNRKALKSCLMKLAVNGKSDLKERLLLNKSKISIACDGWKSSNNVNFMGMFLCCIELCVANSHSVPLFDTNCIEQWR